MMEFYEVNAEAYIKQTKNADMSAAYDHFCKYLKKEDDILDVGCGSGRDLKYFTEQGFQAEGLEPAKAIYHILIKEQKAVVYPVTIQEFMPKRKYHAIWACASFLHLPENEIIKFFDRIEKFLLPDGIIYVSGKKGIQTGYAKDGRFFLEFTEALLEKILKSNPNLELLEKWDSDDGNGRQDIKWMNFILKYKSKNV